MQVIKRDGRSVDFDRTKIYDAILAAMKSVDNINTRTASRISHEIEKEIKDSTSIEEIQDLVEKHLMASSMKDVAKAYILYRNDRNSVRTWNSKLMQHAREKLMACKIANQNANVDEHSFGGRRGEADSVWMKQFALDNCMSEKSKMNHLNNEIYVHDLSEYVLGSHNCLSIPFDDLLAKGFNTRQTDVRPANSINTAFQLVAVICQIQSLQQFGGVSATHLDWTMVPYVNASFRKHFKDGFNYIGTDDYKESLEDIEQKFEIKYGNEELEYYFPKIYKYAKDMTERETQQAVEGLYHNLNTLQSRSGNQLPFTSLNYGTCTLPEGRLIIKSLLEGSIKGVGKFHKTPIFPCGIFQLGKGINRAPGDPNYDLFQLALKSTATRLYPNYANKDWSGNAGYDENDPRTFFSTMGCRTANGFDVNGFGQLKDGRGNICPVTVILPTLAMEAKGEVAHKDIDDFMQILDTKIHEAKDMLIERFEYICSQDPKSAKFMYENNTMAGYVPEEGIRSALKHGTLALGQLGLAETLQILIGKNHLTTEGMELAKRIEQLFKDRCAEFKKEYSLNFGVYYTPAENLAYTAMTQFRKKYGEIPNISDRLYFTNSIHVPVWEEISPFEKIDIESQLTGYSSAGCITYVELGGSILNNLAALEQLVNYAMDKDIPYFAINVPADCCPNCGYQGLIDGDCPKCKLSSDKIQRLRRVTGYLTGSYTEAFNLGKQAEVRDRFRHSRKLEGYSD